MQNNFLLKKILNVNLQVFADASHMELSVYPCEQMYLVLWSWIHAKSSQCVQIDIGDCMHGK